MSIRTLVMKMVEKVLNLEVKWWRKRRREWREEGEEKWEIVDKRIFILLTSFWFHAAVSPCYPTFRIEITHRWHGQLASKWKGTLNQEFLQPCWNSVARGISDWMGKRCRVPLRLGTLHKKAVFDKLLVHGQSVWPEIQRVTWLWCYI